MKNDKNKPFSVDMRGRYRVPSDKSPSNSNVGINSIWAEQKQLEKEEEIERAKRKELKKQKSDKYKKLLNQKLTKSRSMVKRAVSKSAKAKGKRRIIIYSGVTAVLIVAVVGAVGIFNNKKSDIGTLGDSTSSSSLIGDELPREKPNFDLLFPNGSTEEDFDVVRISPLDAEASYTFLDRFSEDGVMFRVTQQEIPEGFDIEKTTKDFQLSDIIQVDDNFIYHGYSEKGKIQSLLFIKEGKLVSVRSPQKFGDDQWAGYYLSLK